MRFAYKCHDCGHEFESDGIVYLCPKCGGSTAPGEFRRGILSVIYDDDELKRLRDRKDLSVYDFMPYPIASPGTFPCGPTALVKPGRIRKETGVDVTLKMDSQLLSGSFKDRASLLVASQAIHHGQTRIALASTGNAGAAMSAIGAAYGLDIILFVPATAPVNKLMQSVLYGAHVVPVRGTYDDAFALSIAYTQSKGGVNRNTAYNPMTIEGKKAASIELFLQMGHEVPDIIYVPTGDGCILGGIYKGFYDLLHAGLIVRLQAHSRRASMPMSRRRHSPTASPSHPLPTAAWRCVPSGKAEVMWSGYPMTRYSRPRGCCAPRPGSSWSLHRHAPTPRSSRTAAASAVERRPRSCSPERVSRTWPSSRARSHCPRRSTTA